MDSKLLTLVSDGMNYNKCFQIRIDDKYIYYANCDDAKVYVLDKSKKIYLLNFNLSGYLKSLYSIMYDDIWINDSLLFMMLNSIIYIFDDKKLKSKIIVSNLQYQNHNFIIVNNLIYLFDYHYYSRNFKHYIINLKIIVINIYDGNIKNIIMFEFPNKTMYFKFIGLECLLQYSVSRYNNGFSFTYNNHDDITYEIKIVDEFVFYDRAINNV